MVGGNTLPKNSPDNINVSYNAWSEIEEDGHNADPQSLTELADKFDPEAAQRARMEAQVAMQESGVEQVEIIDAAAELAAGSSTVNVYIEGGSSMDNVELKRAKNNPNAYTKERQVWHEQILSDAMVASEKLSDELGPPPRIIAMRGGCGAGKTTAVKDRYGGKAIFDANGDVPGAVKPDYFKGVIQQKSINDYGIEITSSQSHMESTGVCKMFSEKLAKTEGVSMLIDKQLEASDDIKEIIKWGKESGKSVELLDNDVPVELSAFRVLKRRIDSPDPNIEFQGVANGFMGIRKNRFEEIEDVNNNRDVVSSYSLRAFDPTTKRQIEIATKGLDGKVTPKPGYEDLYHKVAEQTAEQASDEIEKARNQIIDEQFIEEFVARNFDESNGVTKWSQEARDVLGAYAGLGMTFEQAMKSKAVAGINPDRNEDGTLIDPNYREKLQQFMVEESARAAVA